MEIKALEKLIKSKSIEHSRFIRDAKKAKLYYENKNDIRRKKSPSNRNGDKDNEENTLRRADNRVSHNFHQLLVDQKAAYMFTYPPLFDIDDKELNKKIVDILGDTYAKEAKNLCVEASNTGVGWLHIWRGKDNEFKYKSIDSSQIIGVYSKALDDELIGVLRVYEDMDDDGKIFTICEYWNDHECFSIRKYRGEDTYSEYNIFELVNLDTNQREFTSKITHDWRRVPFIAFRNNSIGANDLVKYKDLIDIYDKVYSGFVNDIEDIQEVILVLTNYTGTDLKEFWDNLIRKKTLKVENEGGGDKSGVDKLTIDIPVEARKELLTITRKQIFESGQGVDPQDDAIGNASGVALKFKYSLLELKSGLTQTEFEPAFAELIKFILIHLGKDPNMKVKQTWTRTSINNDLEQAEIISKLAPSTSKENIAKANPIVEDWEAEIDLLEKEGTDDKRMENDYKNNFDVNLDE